MEYDLMLVLDMLIKPASGLCNIDCEYCFYKDIMKHRKVTNYGHMTRETLENIVKKAYEETDLQVTFSFQGGEPLLVGYKFYQDFFEFIDKYNVNKISTNVSVQTNGLLLTEELTSLFKKYNVLVGISLDGPAQIHDLYRYDYQKHPTYSHVLNAIELLQKYNVEFNILTVLTKNVARNITEIYEFYKEQGFSYIQFIEVMDKNLCQSGRERYSLNNKDYYIFLKDLFTLWYHDFMNGKYISIRLFDSIIQNLLGNLQVLPCFYLGRCQNQRVIEANGNIYPCDFYCLDEYYLGNINEVGFKDINEAPLLKDFIQESLELPNECKQCPYLRLCRNGCKRYRINNKYYYCEAITRFYDNNLPKFKKVVEKISKIYSENKENASMIMDK